MVTRKTAAFQRFLKRRIERQKIRPYIKQLYNWNEDQYKAADIRWNWGMKKELQPEVKDIVQILTISAQTGVPYISIKEAREMLRGMGWKLEEAIPEMSEFPTIKKPAPQKEF